jgi:glycosyltransferase involved in cell wall biosynthesis
MSAGTAAPVSPLVSVVTPVYNGGAYLAECIESVLAQTLPDFEYVIVDNCSTDNTLDLAQHYGERDRRVRVVVNSTFLKQFQNWNHALRQISPHSCYVKVVHADDWLFPECLERMVAVSEAWPTAALVGAYRLEEDRVSLDGLPYPSPCTPGRTLARRYLLEELNPFGSPTSLLLRADVVRQPANFYDEGLLHSDTAVCLRLLQDHDFGFVHQVLTFTRRHNEALTSVLHRLQTMRAARLRLFQRYGPIFLTEAEFQQRWDRVLENHYRFLALSLFDRAGREFWDFQRQQLQEAGFPLSRARLVRAAAIELLDVRQVARRWRRARLARAGRPSRAPSAAAALASISSREPAPAVFPRAKP